MSLDVWLTGKWEEEPCRCPHCDHEHVRLARKEFYSSNITHNLVRIAIEAGIYNALWRPEEIGITKAAQLIPILEAGLECLWADPARFKVFDAANGWGTYEQFTPWLSGYLSACKEWPHADVNASR